MGGEDEDGGASRTQDPSTTIREIQGELGAFEGAHGILSAASSRPSSFLAPG